MYDPVVEAFAIAHPDDVAKRLSKQLPDETSEFLQNLSVGVAASVLARLNGTHLQSVLVALPTSLLSNILRKASHDDLLTLIAHIPNARYEEIVDAADNHADELRDRLNTFADRTVGAVVSPDFVAIRKGRLVRDALDELRGSAWIRDVPVYVTDSEGVLIGQVATLAMMSRQHEETEIDRLAIPVPTLPEHMNADIALESPHWQLKATLPVIDSKKRLLGTINRRQLTLSGHAPNDGNSNLEDVISDLISDYFSICVHLLEVLVRTK